MSKRQNQRGGGEGGRERERDRDEGKGIVDTVFVPPLKFGESWGRDHVEPGEILRMQPFSCICYTKRLH